ncbi:hypothetical protein H0H93_006636, partial [Arthromyces matolae]
NPLGLGYLQMTVDRGRRSSAATSYLSPLFTSRPSLDVVVNSRVVRIIQTGGIGGRPHFGAVEVVNRNGRVVGTPQLLLLSGIGDATDLRRVGIAPLIELQDVGRNFHDDPLITLTYHVTAGLTMDDIKNGPSLYDNFLSEWNRTNTGPFAAISNSFINWGRVPDSSPIWNNFSDPAAGRNTPHYGQYPLNGGPYPGGQYLTMLSLLVTPISRGTVSLRTSNPFDQPLIDPRYMSSRFDMVAMIEAVRNSQRFITAPPWRGYVLRPVAGQENLNTDDQISQFILRNMRSGIHGVGTANMSPRNANHGVVDPDFRVKGASGLRVVDASVFPYMPAGHTQAPVYILAERASDIIAQQVVAFHDTEAQAALFTQ